MIEICGLSLEESGPFVVTAPDYVREVVRTFVMAEVTVYGVETVIEHALTHGYDFFRGCRGVVDAFHERLGRRYRFDRHVFWVVIS